MTRVYKTFQEATADLGNAMADLSHGGKQEVYVEKHTLGFVIAEFKIMADGVAVFQRYYDGGK